MRAAAREASPTDCDLSRAFGSLIVDLDPDKKLVILDFGAATHSTVEFFSSYNCRLYVPDTARRLPVVRKGDLPLDAEQFEVLLPKLPKKEKLDVVLCWELLNYLEPDAVERLGRFLEPHVQFGTALMTVQSSRGTINRAPTIYHILGPSKVRRVIEDDRPVAARTYSQPDLFRMLPRFEVNRSYLLQNGMQEYLLSVT